MLLVPPEIRRTSDEHIREAFKTLLSHDVEMEDEIFTWDETLSILQDSSRTSRASYNVKDLSSFVLV